MTETDLATEVRYIRRDVDKILKKLDDHYVTRAEFAPVKLIVFGMVGLILTSVLVAVIGLVVSKSI